MEVKNLHFFDKSGYELNFNWNDILECWEGNIYLPTVSVGLYANSSIYVLEEYTDDKGNKQFIFPIKKDSETKSTILFSWDILNKFVDEFFMFTFDSSYIQDETSSLIYNETDGPVLDKNDILLITRFDTYEINLESNIENKALPIHIAFTSPEKYDANTFRRTLIMEYNFKQIARITFYAETVEEDERLKILNTNLGYNITKEDEFIFRKSDIREPKTDFKLLNEKRKELLINGHEIYPHIGSYKALINALKFFGYDNLNIIDIWRNVNIKSDNFGKSYYVKKYRLSDNEIKFINQTNINLPSSEYKKSPNISLSYYINDLKKNDGEYIYDELEFPEIIEKWDYTLEDAIIKLFALRDKLNREFLPGRSRIVDIMGEASYFGLCAVNNNVKLGGITNLSDGIDISISAYPNNEIRISSDKLFNEFIYKKKINYWNDKIKNLSSIIENINDSKLEYIKLNEIYEDASSILKSEKELCDYYKKFYKEINVNFTINDDITDDLNDYLNINEINCVIEKLEAFKEKSSGEKNKEITNIINYFKGIKDKFNYTFNQNDIHNISAKVILTNESIEEKTFGNIEYAFNNIKPFATFGNIDSLDYNEINWSIKFSDDQEDEDLKNIGIEKIFDKQNFTSTKGGLISEYNSVLFELPFIGYYDVTIQLIDSFNNISQKTLKKYIKVEPYNIDIRGFYYDARKIPESIINNNYINILNGDNDNSYYYNADDTSYLSDNSLYINAKEFISNKIKSMMQIATPEASSRNGDNSIPVFHSDYDTLKCKVYFNSKNRVVKIDEIYNNKLKTIKYNTENEEIKITVEKEYIKFFSIEDNESYRIYYDYDKTDNKFNYLEYNSKTKTYKKSKTKTNEYPFFITNYKPRVINVNAINQGPYIFDNMFEEWLLADNLNIDITTLQPNIKYVRYIKNGVDIKPYTWFILGYEYSLIRGKLNPRWTLINTTLNETYNNLDYIYDDISKEEYSNKTFKEKEEYKKSLPTHKGKFFTYLLKNEGNYKIILELDDINGNHYSIERNIFVVSNDANYKLYTPFLNDFEDYINEKTLKELKSYNSFIDDEIDDSDINDDEIDDSDSDINDDEIDDSDYNWFIGYFDSYNTLIIDTDYFEIGKTYTLSFCDESGNELPSWTDITKFEI